MKLATGFLLFLCFQYCDLYSFRCGEKSLYSPHNVRRMSIYIHQQKDWPHFQWKIEDLWELLSAVRHHQGRLLGRMETLGFSIQKEAMLQTITLDVLKSSEIEGEILNSDQVRSSIARRLGIDIGALTPADRDVEGVVEMMLDATQNYDKPLTAERLFDWHAALFPTGRSGMYKITVGAWRKNDKGPMQVVSGPLGKERIHYEAPDAPLLEKEMEQFIEWFNSTIPLDPVLKAAIAHLWFVTIHPFDDGNGRIARAIADMQLARADGSPRRFYSMSAQIRKERNAYYDILEKTQKATLYITEWLKWFLNCLEGAINARDETLSGVLKKAQFWDTHKNEPLNSRQQLLLNKILDGFEGKLTSSKWAKIAETSQDTALRDIQDLLNRGILIKEPGSGRSTSYVLNEVNGF
jgi:Fic family protein